MRLLLALIFSLIAIPALADDALTFDRASTIGQAEALPTAGIYMYITNKGDSDTITAVETPLSHTAFLSRSEMNDKNVAVTTPVKSIAVPGAGKTTVLNPNGDHIMVRDVGRVLTPDGKIPVTLIFEKAGKKIVNVDVVTIEEFAKRFPPEVMGDTLEKIREAKDIMDNSGKKKNWAAKMRERIRALGGKGGPLDLETDIETPTPLPTGRPAMEPPVINTDPMPSPVPPKGAIVEGPMSVPADAIPTSPGLTPEEFEKLHNDAPTPAQ